MNIYNVVITDYIGGVADLQILQSGKWLHHADVFYHTVCTRGQWKIKMVFVGNESKMFVLCRYIDQVFSTIEKAEVFAKMYVRTSQKKSISSNYRIRKYIINFN